MSDGRDLSPRWATLYVAALALVGAGWFALSKFIAHNDAGTAAGESIGVLLAVLLLASVIGVVRGQRGRDGGADE